jgi:hypothetical protein
MKIIGLNPKLRREVQALRASHAAVVATFTRRNKDFSGYDTRRARLESEISKLEDSADPDDRPKILKIAELKTELGLVQKRLAALSTASDEPIDELTPLLDQARDVLGRAIAPTLENLIDTAARALRPFCQDDAWARGQAGQLPIIAHAGPVLLWPNRLAVTGIGIARLIIKRCDEILAGELNWTFNPKITKRKK